MTEEVRVTMPETEMRRLMSAGFKSLITFSSCRLNVFTCTKENSAPHVRCLCSTKQKTLRLSNECNETLGICNASASIHLTTVGEFPLFQCFCKTSIW